MKITLISSNLIPNILAYLTLKGLLTAIKYITLKLLNLRPARPVLYTVSGSVHHVIKFGQIFQATLEAVNFVRNSSFK